MLGAMPFPAPPPTCRWLPALALACVLSGGLTDAARATDFWQVRSYGRGDSRVVESISVINRAMPTGTAHHAPTFLLHERSEGALAVRVHADAATAALLQAPGVDVSAELEQALRWLGRLRTPLRQAARIELHLLAPDRQVRMQRRHRAIPATVVELAMSVTRPPALPAISSQVGEALATALHEMAHALDAGSGRSREDDEYRASLVAACYTFDTLRAGDVLHLRQAIPAPTDASFVETHSRRAAARVVEDMATAAGSREIRARDHPAVMALQRFCATGFPGPVGTGDQPLAR